MACGLRNWFKLPDAGLDDVSCSYAFQTFCSLACAQPLCRLTQLAGHAVVSLGISLPRSVSENRQDGVAEQQLYAENVRQLWDSCTLTAHFDANADAEAALTAAAAQVLLAV